MRDRAGADATESLPESVKVMILAYAASAAL